MNRRAFLKAAGSATAALSAALRAFSLPPGSSASVSGWQIYEVSTTVEVLRPVGRTQIWVPLALEGSAPFQRVLGTQVGCLSAKARRDFIGAGGLRCVQALFVPGTRPALMVTQRIATRDWRVDLQSAEWGTQLRRDEVRQFLQPTRYVPTDGLVKAKADEMTRGAQTDEEKARAVYAWVVENTYRDAKARGCGRGDVAAMLRTGDLGGKCADLNALFVGLLRATGVPARDVYGVRVGPSLQGFKSLGTQSEDSTRAQHCRAEVYLDGHGWVPMDPADVRKLILEESPGSLTLKSACVKAVRDRLFGSWEMNWVAFNYAQDVQLPGSHGPALPFFMYPVVETEEGRLDSLDPDNLRYAIRSRKLGVKSV